MEYVYNREEWRLKRLQKAVRLVCAILGISQEQISALIVQIADIQGALDVLWAHPSTHIQRHAFMTAWAECGEQVVTHRVDAEDDLEADRGIF